MEVLAAYDPYMIFALSVGFVLTLCVVILYMMRDPYAVPPHRISRSVWCAPRRRRVTVDFIERVDTGLVHRSVQHCSIRKAGDACDESCCY